MSAILFGLVGLGIAMATKVSASEISKVVTPDGFDNLFKKYANQNGLDWRFLKTISMNESSLGENPRVKKGISNPKDIQGSKSTDGKSWGIMQLTIPTARDYDPLASEEKLNNPEYSIKIASQFIFSLKRMFNGNLRDMAMAYNHGAGNQKRFIELEKTKLLKTTDFPAGRAYWDKTQKNYQLIFGSKIA